MSRLLFTITVPSGSKLSRYLFRRRSDILEMKNTLITDMVMKNEERGHILEESHGLMTSIDDFDEIGSVFLDLDLDLVTRRDPL